MPKTVKRVWDAVENAPRSKRTAVARAFSRPRLLAAVAWNDRNGDFENLDRNALADILVDWVNENDEGAYSVVATNATTSSASGGIRKFSDAQLNKLVFGSGFGRGR